MPVIVFASPKGGVGKTTALLTLGSTIAKKGGHVTIIDADPEQHAYEWVTRQGSIKNIEVKPYPGEAGIIDLIEESEAETQFVLVDLEGTANMLSGYAISRADLVIIPMQPSRMDAKSAIKAVKLVKQQEKAFKIKIPTYILQTMTSAMVQTKVQKALVKQFSSNDVRFLEVELISRIAFKEMDCQALSLYDLPKETSGVAKAILNAERYTIEVTEILKRGE